jgi:hypothetical protein
MRKFFIAAAVAVATLVGGTSSADAAFQFEVTITDQTTSASYSQSWDGSSINLDGNPTITVLKNVGGFGVSFEIAVSNSPGGPTLAMLSQSANSVTNNTGETHTLNITATATGYTAPVSPPDIMIGSALGGTVTSGSLSNVTFNSYIGTGNAPYEQSIAADTVGPKGATGPSGALSATTHTLVTLTANPYSLTSSLTATFSGNTNVTNLSGNTTLTNTPAPAGLVLALTGMPALGLGTWFRRRRSQQQV